MIEPIVVAIILGVLGWITRLTKKSMNSHNKAHDLLQEANLFQIKATLLFLYRHGLENGRKITVAELNIFNDLFVVYTKLGGNGFINTLQVKLNKMEIVDEEYFQNEVERRRE